MTTLGIKDLPLCAVMESAALARVAGGRAQPSVASSPHGLHWAIAHPNDPWSQAFAAWYGPGWQDALRSVM